MLFPILFCQSRLYILDGDTPKAGQMKIGLGKGLTVADAHRLHPAGVGCLDLSHGILKNDAFLGRHPQLRRALQKHLRIRFCFANLGAIHDGVEILRQMEPVQNQGGILAGGAQGNDISLGLRVAQKSVTPGSTSSSPIFQMRST